ncbi:MAG TPA: recombination mediator RecR [Phycisphaerae bacterium]|nr:recombination protein RecR [Phycisphaerae bacterium]HOB73018.1 recombination mediator RecR [Phycisphaerae bacterium]HOJ52933.1 recombination mediator RecR [Phycisphaerae bacterium]HOL24670.1 recombination mediator RecR [Phycisphaerae bacterium]HPP19206.1 recombination mediator RecR [Phycisphaerae bacterium]
MNDLPRGIPESLARLMAELNKLPGIGPRSAERIAFHLLRAAAEDALPLAQAIVDVKQNLRHCSQCFNLTESDPCVICGDPQRDASLIVVVEQPKDVMLLEQTGLIRGVYHVLMGHIAPLEGVEPGDLTIDALVNRVRAGTVREVLLATNPTLEGDGTALYIQDRLKNTGVTISRLARGLPVGSQVEYASRAMLEAAITGRTPL